MRIGIGIGLCVDLMCGYRPVSCADGIAIYKPDPGVTGFPIGHARRVPRRQAMVDAPRHGPNIDARRQPHIERDPIPAARDVRRPGGGTAEGRGELLDAARSVISASIAQHTRK